MNHKLNILASSFQNWKPKYLTDDEYTELQ